MGYTEFVERCFRISCVRLWVCLRDALDSLRMRLSGKGQSYQLIKEPDEENLGLLTEPDLGLEEVVDLKDDAKLREKAREIVEKKAAKKLAKVNTKYTEDETNDEEDAWLDSLKSDDGQ
jgi:hypothetical protein